ncbi:MAG: DUF935 family protein [Opitutaceae bacterium]|jgi:hypothetical protein
MNKPLPVKQESSLGVERIAQQIQSRFNPIRNLDPARLSQLLDNFQRGDLSEIAHLWDAIERRDFQCQAVIPKRKRATALLNYEILVEDDSPEAAAQKEALEYFYDNIDATDALDQDQHGGFTLLVEQMMDAVGKKYAVHEILWQPQRVDNQDRLTAQLVRTPLWFFEHRTGRLRFLKSDYDFDGVSLEEGGWLVTVSSSPLMEATSVAYVYKNLSLKDWLIFSERFGMPLPHGKTSAEQGTKQWTDFVDAIRNINIDWSLVSGEQTSIQFHDMSASGDRPQKPLVEYMDRGIAILWRGGDLSTISADTTGATQQTEERENIEAADALMINETLWNGIDKLVRRALFGPDAPALAYVAIQPKLRTDSEREMKIWDFGVQHGVPLSKADFRKRFGLPSPKLDDNGNPDPDDPILEKTAAAAPFGAQGFGSSNERRAALDLLDAATLAEMDDLRSAVASNSKPPSGNRIAKALELLLSLPPRTEK